MSHVDVDVLCVEGYRVSSIEFVVHVVVHKR